MSTQREPILKSYNTKIKAISAYFDVSYGCAIYMYHRRKRGSPWKKKDDPKYLEFTKSLQDKLVILDKIGSVSFTSLKFSDEGKILLNLGYDDLSSSIDVQLANNYKKLPPDYKKIIRKMCFFYTTPLPLSVCTLDITQGNSSINTIRYKHSNIIKDKPLLTSHNVFSILQQMN